MAKKLKTEKRSIGQSDIVNTLVDDVNSELSEDNQLSRKQVKAVVDIYHQLMLDEVRESGIFAVPGVVKMVRKFKPATKARKGTNPFTGEPCTFKAKPATYSLKARPLTKAKAAARGEK